MVSIFCFPLLCEALGNRLRRDGPVKTSSRRCRSASNVCKQIGKLDETTDGMHEIGGHQVKPQQSADGHFTLTSRAVRQRHIRLQDRA